MVSWLQIQSYSVRSGKQCTHDVPLFWRMPAPIPLNVGASTHSQVFQICCACCATGVDKALCLINPNVYQNIYSWMPASVFNGWEVESCLRFGELSQIWHTLSELDSMAIWCPGIGWWASSSVSYTCLFSSSHPDADALTADPKLSFLSLCCWADFEYRLFRSIRK